MKRICLAGLALLAACGTPQEQCISRNTRDLRVVTRLISETEGNLARGYAFEEVTIFETVQVPCRPPGTDPAAPPRLCMTRVPETELRPKAIDLTAEAAKLESLRTKQRSLARAAEEVTAACQKAYPE